MTVIGVLVGVVVDGPVARGSPRTVLGAVEQINLDGFYGAYPANGQDRAAYDPRTVVSPSGDRSDGRLHAQTCVVLGGCAIDRPGGRAYLSRHERLSRECGAP
jgi:hypothetical protein